MKFPLLGGRLTVGLRTLNPPIGVRIPASQPKILNNLRQLLLLLLLLPALILGRPKPAAVFAGDDERLDHLRLHVVAIKLLELC